MGEPGLSRLRQPKFLLHDGVAAGVFNASYNGCAPGLQPWDAILVNSGDVLDLMLARMKKDFESMSVKMRKPWGLKELAPRFQQASNNIKYIHTPVHQRVIELTFG